MERGDVARLLQVADADVESYEQTDGGLFVDLRDAGRVVVTAEGVFACDDHPGHRQLRQWPGRGTSLRPEMVPAPEETFEPGAAAAVPDGTAEVVLAWVDGDPERALAAWDAEQARDKPRSTLLAALEKLVSE